MDDAGALFRQYENEYCNKSTDISRKIDAVSNLSGELRRRKVADVEAELRDAEQVIKRLDMEARSLPPEQSRKLVTKVKEYKGDLNSLKEKLRKVSASSSSAGDAARAELGLGTDYYSSSAGQRDRMLEATARLEQSSERIRQGKQQLLETEALGAAVLQSLQQQRETIQHAQSGMDAVHHSFKTSDKTLKTMQARAKWPLWPF